MAFKRGIGFLLATARFPAFAGLTQSNSNFFKFLLTLVLLQASS